MESKIYHIAQINIAHARHHIDHPEMAEFKNALDRINHLASEQPGYVWKSEEDKTYSPWPEEILPNLSVWQDIESLMSFSYKTEHRDFLIRRQAWFQKLNSSHLALWWIPAGHRPSLDEAKKKIDYLDNHGPSSDAFHFGKTFPPPF